MKKKNQLSILILNNRIVSRIFSKFMNNNVLIINILSNCLYILKIFIFSKNIDYSIMNFSKSKTNLVI